MVRRLFCLQQISCISFSIQVFLVLFEHAAGYALFRCQDVEDIGSLLPEVQEAVMDYSRFTSMVNLEAFSPFKTGANALDNINSISEGSLHHVTYMVFVLAYDYLLPSP